MNHPEDGAQPTSLVDQRLGAFLQVLGSAEPTPGGGAAAALAGAMGAALIRMTANLSIGRPRLADVQAQATRIEHQAAALIERLQRLADADAEAFSDVTAAYRLPRQDEAQRGARSAAIQRALLGAARVPLDTASACAEVLALAEDAAPILNASVISDVLVGALLAAAALQSAAINVEINLASMTDADAIARLQGELDRARADLPRRLDRILAAGRSRFPGHGS